MTICKNCGKEIYQVGPIMSGGHYHIWAHEGGRRLACVDQQMQYAEPKDANLNAEYSVPTGRTPISLSDTFENTLKVALVELDKAIQDGNIELVDGLNDILGTL